jgi:hypothetical protein
MFVMATRQLVTAFMYAIAAAATSHIAGAQRAPLHYSIVDSIKVGQVEWEFYAVDDRNRRLYGGGNTVVNIDAKHIDYSIADSIMAGGFQVAPELSRGLARTGLVFDLRTGNVLARLPVKGHASTYDPLTKRVFLFADTVSVVDLRRNRLAGQVVLPGASESGVPDGRGRIYLNLIKGDSITSLDSRSLRRFATWSLAPCHTPRGLAMDQRNRRLFVACQGSLTIVDADDGHVVSSMPLPGRSAENAFDPATGLIFMPNGGEDGLTIFHEDSPNTYSVVQSLVAPQLDGVRVVLDLPTHRAFMAHRDANGDFWWVVLVPGA